MDGAQGRCSALQGVQRSRHIPGGDRRLPLSPHWPDQASPLGRRDRRCPPSADGVSNWRQRTEATCLSLNPKMRRSEREALVVPAAAYRIRKVCRNALSDRTRLFFDPEGAHCARSRDRVFQVWVADVFGDQHGDWRNWQWRFETKHVPQTTVCASPTARSTRTISFPEEWLHRTFRRSSASLVSMADTCMLAEFTWDGA